MTTSALVEATAQIMDIRTKDTPLNTKGRTATAITAAIARCKIASQSTLGRDPQVAVTKVQRKMRFGSNS